MPTPSALFANQRETNLASTIVLVEEALADLGHSVATSRADEPASLRAWRVHQGSASTTITLLHRTELSHLRVCSAVMTLDDKVDRDSLFAHLLGLNTSLCGAAFALDGDRVLVVSERSTLDLDKSEIVDVIRRVSTCADEHDDVLISRYGGAKAL
jgi:hypothetical protein